MIFSTLFQGLERRNERYFENEDHSRKLGVYRPLGGFLVTDQIKPCLLGLLGTVRGVVVLCLNFQALKRKVNFVRLFRHRIAIANVTIELQLPGLNRQLELQRPDLRCFTTKEAFYEEMSVSNNTKMNDSTKLLINMTIATLVAFLSGHRPAPSE